MIGDFSVWQIVFGFLAFGFILSGLDDLIIDTTYWLVQVVRWCKYPRRRHPLLREEDLDSVPQMKAALCISAWREDDVIAQCLLCNRQLIDYQNYDFFVGTYPNDEATGAEVDRVKPLVPNLHKAVTPHPGPTSKADCLNGIFAEIKRQEALSGEQYGFILIHDPEDVMHPLEMKLANYLFAKRGVEMVQTPVFPLEAKPLDFVSGTYMDAFAEIHSKDMYVREWIKGFVPSAGVGTSIARPAFDRMAREWGDRLFCTESLTEDYEMGARMRLSGLKAIFVRQAILRRKTHTARGIAAVIERVREALGCGERGEWIATRALFPHTFHTAMRQRSRWVLGQVFQSWKNIGWQGHLAMKWLLFHDRKGIWANTLILTSYIFIALVGLHELLRATVFLNWSPALPNAPWIRAATTICFWMMVNRMAQRAIATTRIYGIGHGLLAIPRHLMDNAINVCATWRATGQFLRARKANTKIAWDKTQHYFPSNTDFSVYTRPLGELLLSHFLVTPEQLDFALETQKSTKTRLGEAILQLGYVTSEQLEHILAQQYAAKTGEPVEASKPAEAVSDNTGIHTQPVFQQPASLSVLERLARLPRQEIS